MKKQMGFYVLFFTILAMAESCKQVYTPPSTSTSNKYLVVDGFLNAGNDSTIFTLSRTVSLTSDSNPSPETGAQIIVEGSTGDKIPLTELGNGRYGAFSLPLNSAENYRVRITTTVGSVYLSNYTSVKSSPPIDSISWRLNGIGVSIYANTHDPLNNTRYYRWDYVETWEYQSQYQSDWHHDSSSYIPLFENGFFYPHLCWRTDNSTNIIIGSSAKLTKDIISMAPLIIVPISTEQISVKYSILVRQYALTVDEYNYWQNLQLNTELTGSIFDLQPSQITGNISCITNPSEPAIGYVGAGTVATSRIFISNNQLSPLWDFNKGCNAFFVKYDADSVEAAYKQGALPTTTDLIGDSLLGYWFSPAPCVDCTASGGTSIMPSFWQ